MKSPIFWVAASLAALMVVGCGRGDGGAFATVNGDAISKTEFNEYLAIKPTVAIVQEGSTPQRAVVAGSLGLQALEDLIRQRLVLQMAKDEGVMPNAAEVAQELDFRTKQQPDFVRALMRRGLTMEMVRRDLTIQLAQFKLLTRGITVTDAEVDQFIKDNPQRWTTPALVEMRWIVVNNPQQRAEADKRLRSAQAFQSVAAELSQAPGAREAQGKFTVPNNPFGASVPVQSLDQLAPGLSNRIRNTAEGRQTDWVQAGTQFAKFLVERKTPENKRTISAEDREQVKRDLAAQRGAQAIDLDRRIADRLVEAKVEINSSSLKEQWDQAMERLKQARERSAQ